MKLSLKDLLHQKIKDELIRVVCSELWPELEACLEEEMAKAYCAIDFDNGRPSVMLVITDNVIQELPLELRVDDGSYHKSLGYPPHPQDLQDQIKGIDAMIAMLNEHKRALTTALEQK